MAANKIIYGNTVLIDLTQDTVTPQSLLGGVTAHAKDGSIITGSFKGIQDPYITDFHNGYVTSGGKWKYVIDGTYYNDIYKIRKNRTYFLATGSGNYRLNMMMTDQDVSQLTEDITGTSITANNTILYYGNHCCIFFDAAYENNEVFNYLIVDKGDKKTYLYDIDEQWT